VLRDVVAATLSLDETAAALGVQSSFRADVRNLVACLAVT
jgi:hypothetical protein